MWWDVLKNAKLSGKAKGSTLDTNRININTDDNDCKEKLRKLIWFNTTEPAPDDIAQQVDTGKGGNALIDTKEFNKLPEEIACEILQEIYSYKNQFDDYDNYKDYKDARINRFGDSYKLYVFVLDEDIEDIIRYYIFNGTEDVAWVMFPFSDLKKWKDAQ